MIGFVIEDGVGAIELFGEEEEGDLMWECHGREGEHAIGFGFDGRGEAGPAADDKDDSSGCSRRDVIEFVGECLTIDEIAFFGHGDEEVAGFDLCQDALGFFFDGCGFCAAVAFGFFFDADEFAGAVSLESLQVVIDTFFEIAVFESTNDDNEEFHDIGVVQALISGGSSMRVSLPHMRSRA